MHIAGPKSQRWLLVVGYRPVAAIGHSIRPMAAGSAIVLKRRRLAWAARLHPGFLMPFPVRACALVGRVVEPRVAESVNTLLAHLKERQVQVLVSEDAVFSGEVSGVVRVSEREIGKRIDLIIAI